MSRVVTQPRPCEESNRSVAAMSFSFWSSPGKRGLTRAAAGLAMWKRGRVRIEQTLTHYEQVLKKKQLLLKPGLAIPYRNLGQAAMKDAPSDLSRREVGRSIQSAGQTYLGGSGACLYGCLGSL